MELKEAIAGLKAGRTLVVDRKDCPILPELLKMVDEGKLESTFVEYDQGSAIKFKWKTECCGYHPDRCDGSCSAGVYCKVKS